MSRIQGLDAAVITEPPHRLEVCNPVAERYGGEQHMLAPRPKSLAGKTLGLLWNAKPNGDVALRKFGALAEQHVLGLKVVFYSGSLPCSARMLETVRQESDVVVAATADCGSCTSLITHDCAQLEKAGVPTAIIASAGFEKDILASSKAFGIPGGIPHSVVPLVYNNITAEQAEAQTEPVLAETLAMLVARAGKDLTETASEPAAESDDEDPVHFTADTVEGLIDAFNNAFLQRDWGDGYPLHPPTAHRVDAILEGLASGPEDVICLLPPGNGEATVRKVAVNCVMAGCRPADLPVVAAILRAFAKMPSRYARAGLMSTSAHAPFVIVNGPIAKQVGINGGRGCLGPGRQNEVNLRIGRAVALSLRNIGSWRHGEMDMDSVGTLRKHVGVIAENEAESPWEPYHVSRGFKAGDSTVTVVFTGGEWDISFQGHLDAQHLARVIAANSGGVYSSGYFNAMHNEPTSEDRASPLGRLLLVPPPHAIPLHEGGFSKRGFEEFLFHHGAEPITRLREPNKALFAAGKVAPEWEWIFHLDDVLAERTKLPVIQTAASYRVVVAGSVRGKDLLMPTRTPFVTEMVTRKLDGSRP